MIPFHLVWKNESGDRVFRGWDYTAEKWSGRELAHGVLHPKDSSEIQTVVLHNPARERRIQLESTLGKISTPLETVTNIKLYLDADPLVLDTLRYDWPSQNGGVELSMDHGQTWKPVLGSVWQSG